MCHISILYIICYCIDLSLTECNLVVGLRSMYFFRSVSLLFAFVAVGGGVVFVYIPIFAILSFYPIQFHIYTIKIKKE